MITIRSAAELDALPVGSVVRCDDAEGIGLNVCERHKEGWQYVGSSLHFSSAQVASDKVFAVLYRPDALARTEPTEEQVAELSNALAQVFDIGTSPNAMREARAVLALLPQRVAPSEEEIARVIFDVRDGDLDTDEWEDANWETRERYECDARAVLKLYASAPTVAEVKAEAWDEGVAWMRRNHGAYTEHIKRSNPYRQEAGHA